MSRLALAIDGGFRKAAGSFAIAVAPETARVLRDFVDAEVLILARDPKAGDVGVARLLGIATDETGQPEARLDAGRRLGSAATLAPFLQGPFPLQLVSDHDYAAIAAAARRETFEQFESTPKGDLADVSAGFTYVVDPDASPVNAVLDTLRRETGNLCALTSVPVVPGTLPIAIRWEGADRLHLNNLLLLSSAPEAAFRRGHFAIRDDFSIIVDFRRIDPELLERINPDGRLRVSENSALRPAPENLAWHRRFVFGLN